MTKIIKRKWKSVQIAIVIFICLNFFPQSASAVFIPGGGIVYSPTFVVRPADRTVTSLTSLTWKAYVFGDNSLTNARLYEDKGNGYVQIKYWSNWNDYIPLNYIADFPSINPGQSISYTYKMVIYNQYKYTIDYVIVTFFYDNDVDKDGLPINNEAIYGTSDNDPDCDDDLLSDYEEVTLGSDGFITDPLDSDTDDDGISDYDEITIYNSDPTNYWDPNGEKEITHLDVVSETMHMFHFEGSLNDEGHDAAYSSSSAISYTVIDPVSGNQALNLDDENDFAQVYYPWGYSAPYSEGSFECSFQPKAITDWSIIMGAANFDGELELFVGFSTDGYLVAYIDGVGTLYGDTELTIGHFYHILFTFDSTGATLWLNGKIDDTVSTTNFWGLPANTACGVGNIGSLTQFEGSAIGYVDDFRVSNVKYDATDFYPLPIVPHTQILVDFDFEHEYYDVILSNEGFHDPLRDLLTEDAITGTNSLELSNNDYVFWRYYDFYNEGTIELYFQPYSISTDAVILQCGYSIGYPTPILYESMIIGFCSDGRIYATMSENGLNFDSIIYSTTHFEVGNIYHIAYTFGQNGKALYINGFKEGSKISDTHGLFYDPYKDSCSLVAGNIFNENKISATEKYDDIRLSNITRSIFPHKLNYIYDFDLDGLLNVDEETLNLNPTNPDIDNDGLTDGEEIIAIYGYASNPKEIDSDFDGINDYNEVLVYNTIPISNDTDFDGLNDYEEIMIYNTDPRNYDSDSDSIPDNFEISFGLNPLFNDALNDKDGDSLNNLMEYQMNLNPSSVDSDLDGIHDQEEDFDGDGYSNYEELFDQTYPSDPLDAMSLPRPPEIQQEDEGVNFLWNYILPSLADVELPDLLKLDIDRDPDNKISGEFAVSIQLTYAEVSIALKINFEDLFKEQKIPGAKYVKSVGLEIYGSLAIKYIYTTQDVIIEIRGGLKITRIWDWEIAALAIGLDFSFGVVINTSPPPGEPVIESFDIKFEPFAWAQITTSIDFIFWKKHITRLTISYPIVLLWDFSLNPIFQPVEFGPFNIQLTDETESLT
ncbi:LamG-like jellyroll fold domain-containing protein [Candidatus Harpocratesius sp.]